MHYHDWELVSEENGYGLYKCYSCMRGTVVGMNRTGQVFSVGSDSPEGGGQWYASRSSKGVSYVANSRPWPTAKRIFKKLAMQASPV